MNSERHQEQDGQVDQPRTQQEEPLQSVLPSGMARTGSIRTGAGGHCAAISVAISVYIGPASPRSTSDSPVSSSAGVMAMLG